MKGGYKVISFKGENFTLGTAKTIKGIYERIESTNKAILLEDLVIANVEYDAVFISFKVSGTSFIGECYGNTITITDKDAITIAVKA